jgi:hypothetical protein
MESKTEAKLTRDFKDLQYHVLPLQFSSRFHRKVTEDMSVPRLKKTPFLKVSH